MAINTKICTRINTKRKNCQQKVTKNGIMTCEKSKSFFFLTKISLDLCCNSNIFTNTQKKLINFGE